ncbi:MAG TPA: hypothetical protein VMN77_04030 [Nitrospiria bacterium]|jgi:hypothetical protein|nr:hypothetical protein [Nitrospiria bacterium]
MKPFLIGAIGFLIGIILSGGTGLSADLPSKEGPGAEKRTQEQPQREGSTNTERLLMEGTEIQGTLEKPHVVYVIPWKVLPPATEEGVPLRRSFTNEILEPVDRDQFEHRWGSRSRRLQ